MNLINIIKEEYKNILKEDITSGSVIVYHRTKSSANIESISNNGYIPGIIGKYGIGIYATYNLKSQLYNYMELAYGPVIIESKVLSMKDFLIFDYDIAKRIYGNKNYTLDKQLQLILGKEWNNYKDDNNLKLLISELDSLKESSKIAKKFYDDYPDIISKLNGMVYTDEINNIVSYDRNNIRPLRYSNDNGDNWKNIIKTKTYNKYKNYTSDKNTIKYNHILNKIENTVKLNKDEYNLIKDNNNFLSIITNKTISNVLNFYDEPENLLKILGDRGNELISNLNNNEISYIIEYAKNPEKVINILLKNKELISKLNYNNIYHIINKSDIPQKTIKILLGNKELISKLDSDGISLFTNYSMNKDKTIKILLSNKELISKLNIDDVDNILDYSTNSEQLKQIIKQLRPDLNI